MAHGQERASPDLLAEVFNLMAEVRWVQGQVRSAPDLLAQVLNRVVAARAIHVRHVRIPLQWLMSLHVVMRGQSCRILQAQLRIHMRSPHV